MIEFKLPSLGADMDDGTLVEWRIAPGEQVHKGQIVAVVDTTKAAVEVESFQEGTVQRLLVEPGTKVPVGTPIALFSEPPGASTPAPETSELPVEVPSPPVAGQPAITRNVERHGAGRRGVSPAARKLAKELDVNLDDVTGSGPAGVVTLSDVQQAKGLASSGPSGALPEKRAEMRRTIAAAMSRSKREIPHYYLAEPILMERALTWLEQENAPRPITERVLPAALLLKAVARALERYPEFNGTYRGDAFEPASGIHLGVAVALRQGGLVAPALFDANRMSLSELMRSLADLVQRARAGTLRSSELSGASITVTNLGDQGTETVLGVIYPPQVALVGFGRIVDRPWVENGSVTAARIVTASLSADHRVSDGHRGARLLAEIRDILQAPEELVQRAPT